MRCDGAVASASTAVSSDIKAVRSPPPEVVTANTPTNIRTTMSEEIEKPTPPATISSDIAMNIRLRPMVSPFQLASVLESALPAIIALNTSPACSALKSSSVR